MENQLDLIAVNNKIQQITALLNKLQQEAENFPAISKNSKRALASLKMMELNISDLVEFNLHE
ncbi:MAG: hypothetical protein K8R67_14440 [Desulfobacteraceae bacterium]|nr:hypothetical protein [Desulfobacteraceae bacterium]MCK5837204.1 hypothetical protein [Desulfobacula sp.]